MVNSFSSGNTSYYRRYAGCSYTAAGAYGRAARIALQMDKSMMYSILSKYSGDYDTCVNDK